MTTMTSVRDAMDEAERRVTGGLIDRVLEVVSNTGTKAVFGEPVEREGRTVITVARCRYGFGGGSGSGPDGADRGDGAGAGVMAEPVGFIEIGPSGVEYRPIGGERPSAPFLLAAGLSAWLALGGIARLVRSVRR